MELIGYFCAILIGISLGILGSGGSILTVPILVYLMHINPVDATGYSLFVVGITGATGGLTYIRKKLVHFKAAFIFAAPSIVCVFLARKFLMPAIPDVIISSPSFTLSKELLIMLLFALLMIFIAFNMIRKAKNPEAELKEAGHYNYSRIILVGFVSGIFTGILGVGGGFIIIPALVLYAGISVRMSVGTSLIIIAFNSLVGFAEEALQKHATMNYYFLLLFTLFAVAGVFIGFRMSLKLNAVQIKRLFGWLLLFIGTGIFIKEIFFH